MDSSQISEESLSKLQITFSDNQSHNKSLDLECSMLINSQSKDYSTKYNFNNLEKGLNSLSSQVEDLKKKNKSLTESLNAAVQAKEDLVLAHKKQISKLLKENKFLKDALESEKKVHKKQHDKLRAEYEKLQKTLKKLAISAENKIKELQRGISNQKEEFSQELMRKDQDVQELISRIKNIENSACQFKSNSSSSLNQYHSANGHLKKSTSALIGNKSMYSIDQLSEIIVSLEKNQAQLKEKIYNESHPDRKIPNDLALNEMKLNEMREMQKKALRAKQKF